MNRQILEKMLQALESGDLLCEVTVASMLREELAKPDKVPLTREQINQIDTSEFWLDYTTHDFARAIEAAHGITGAAS